MRMRTNTTISRLLMTAAFAMLAGTVFGQLKPNQTEGFGDGQVLKFTYTQNFDCIDQPLDDLNYNGILAQSDPSEMQTPICVVGTQPTINPPGKIGNPFITTEPLYVLVPMFSADNACFTVGLGTGIGSTWTDPSSDLERFFAHTES